MAEALRYGLLTTGFRPKQQADIITEINDTLRGTFGDAINLGAESIWAQLIGAFSEREALLWQLLESIYQAQFPSGAEGLAVDNLLALNNLRRLPARFSVTDPSPVLRPDGVTLYGLVLLGAPGTTIPKGSIIRSSAVPQQDFTLDADVIIAPAVNALQNLTFSAPATQGSFALTMASAGNTLVTRQMPYNTLANQTQLVFSATPTSGTYQLMLGGEVSAALPFGATAAQVQTALRAISVGANCTVSASSNGFVIAWAAGAFNPALLPTGTGLTFDSAPTTGSFALVVNGVQSGLITAPCTAASIQAAIVAMGYPSAMVTDNPAPGTPAYAINFRTPTPPAVALAQNTTGVNATAASLNQTNVVMSAIDSLQAVINNRYDANRKVRPFTDVLVLPIANGYSIAFGAGTPQPSQPSTAAAPQSAITVSSSTVQNQNSVVNLALVSAADGSPARGIGSATAAQTGPISVPAGTLSVIGSPVTGWQAVTNELDVLPGSDKESDADALARRQTQLSAGANGPLPSIIEKVSLLPGVTNVVGFVNKTDAALQLLSFSQVPTTGAYQLLFAGGTTDPIPAASTAGQVQGYIAAVSGYAPVQVSGSLAYGLSIDFAGAFGGQPQPLVQVVSNTTGVDIRASFGRPPRAIELAVQGGSDIAIARAIFQSATGGTATYGTPAAQTSASLTKDSPIVTVGSAANIVSGLFVAGQGILAGTQVAQVSGTQVTLSTQAIATLPSSLLSFSYGAQITDAYGNNSLISFSRPMPLLFYVTVQLVTDQYRTPGVPGSGKNPASAFSAASMAQIQQDIVDIGNATPLGGTVIGFGTNGLIGAFNEVPGVLGYQLFFGTNPTPTSNANITMLPIQVATFQKSLVSVSYI